MAELVTAGWTRHGWWVGTGDKVSPTEQPPTVLPPCGEGPLGGCVGCVADADRILGGRAVGCTRTASHRLGASRCSTCGGKGWHELPEDARADLARVAAPAAPCAAGATNPATPVPEDTKIGTGDLRARLIKLFAACNRDGTDLIDALVEDGWTPDADLIGTLHVDGEHGEGPWYVRILDEPVHQTSEEAPTLIDWTRDGRMVGVELLGPGRPSTQPAAEDPRLAEIRAVLDLTPAQLVEQWDNYTELYEWAGRERVRRIRAILDAPAGEASRG